MSLYTVIGASGFIGGRLVQALRAQGAEVHAPTRSDPELFARDLGRVFYCAGLTGDWGICFWLSPGSKTKGKCKSKSPLSPL